MMRYVALFIIFSFSFTKASALSKEDSIRAYYNNVLEAEYYCIHKDYKDAIKCHRKAFDHKRPFATDVYNLMLCGLDMKDNVLVLDCAERLVKKGASLAFFEQMLFTNFRISEEYKVLQEKYEDWHKAYLTTTNQSLIEYISKLVALDQNVHCGLKVSYDDTAFVNAMHNNDDSLSVILGGLLLKNSYLDEDIVGVSFMDDAVLRKEPRYGIIALHQVQRGGKILTDAINAAIKLGHLRSEVGLGWLSQTMWTQMNLTRKYLIYNDTLWKLRETEEEAMMFQQMSGQLGDNKYALHDVYLDSDMFSVEERVIYNFFVLCKDCVPEIHKSFFILPKAMLTASVKEGHEEAWIKRNHEECDVLAHK